MLHKIDTTGLAVVDIALPTDENVKDHLKERLVED